MGEGGFGGIVRLTVPVASHHIPEVRPGTEMSHNLVDNIGTVVTVMAFIGVILRARLLFFGAFCFRGSDFIAMAS